MHKVGVVYKSYNHQRYPEAICQANPVSPFSLVHDTVDAFLILLSIQLSDQESIVHGEVDLRHTYINYVFPPQNSKSKMLSWLLRFSTQW